jgi:hypothetical protein
MLAAGLLALAATWTTAFAGPVNDFETKMRAAYGQYRVALFTTSAGKGDEAARALTTFRTAWTALGAGNVAPPQYADDARYAATLATVAEIAGKAATEIGSGKLTEAHETLEAIRDQIGSLHERNGIVGFSDRMNAYHARMEEVLAAAPKLDAATLPTVGADVAVLAYLADEVVRLPPPEAATDPAFKALSGDLLASVAAAKAALASGDIAAAKTALGALKAPYAKLFLKFG